MRKLGFNQFDPTFDYSNIQKEFSIIQLSKDEGWLSYSDISKMDLLFTHEACKAVSVCFTGGSIAYVLYKKEELKNTELADILKKINKHEYLRIEKVEAKSIDGHSLLQLFLNACKNSEKPRFRYNNLNGSLYITVPDKSFHNKKDQSRIVLEVKILRGNALKLNTVTFTSLGRYQDLVKNEFGKDCVKRKKRLAQYPRYFFDSKNSTFQRNFNEDRNRNDLYIRMRPKEKFRISKKKKNMIPFFTTNPKKYSSSKIGMLASLLLEDFAEQFSRYVTLKQRIIEKEETKSFKPSKVFFEHLKKTSIYLIDNIGDKELVSEIIRTYQDEFGVIIQARDEVVKDGVNLLFNEDADYYLKNKKAKDPYQKSKMDLVIQNFTRQEYMANPPKQSKGKPQGADQLFKTLLEAQLKFDICHGKLGIFDWSKLKLKKDWVFSIAKLEEESKELIFYFLKISPTGIISFSCCRKGESDSSMEKRIMSVFSEKVDRKGKPRIEGVICDGAKNVNTISKTQLSTLPELSSLHNYVMKGVELSDEEIGKVELLSFMENFIEKNGSNSQIDGALGFIKEEEEGKIMVIKLQETFKKFRMNPLLKTFVYAFKDKYTFWLKHLAKNKTVVDKTFGSMVDLHAIKSSREILFWANKQMGKTKGDFTKTNIVRRLNISGNSHLLFKDLLEMMAVDFVRVDAPSVIPFPFKLLREYQHMIEVPILSEINLDKYNLDV